MRKARTLLCGLAFMASISALSFLAHADITTTDLTSEGLTPIDLANTLVGEGITISNVTYTGDNTAAGTFSGGTGIIGFESGIILSSGKVADVAGPNTADGTTTTFSSDPTPDSDLQALANFSCPPDSSCQI